MTQTTNRPAIPRLRLEVRCPDTGWQVVWVGDRATEAVTRFNVLVEDWPEFSVKLLKISGWQSWSIEMSHAGTHNYAR